MCSASSTSSFDHESFRAFCRQQGWKCTAQRFAVYRCMHENYHHPDVDTVWERVKLELPKITRESVYRILNEFALGGLIQRLDHSQSARYDYQTGPHGHFFCERCGNMSDFAFPKQFDLQALSMPGSAKLIELRITGVCQQCQKNSKS